MATTVARIEVKQTFSAKSRRVQAVASDVEIPARAGLGCSGDDSVIHTLLSPSLQGQSGRVSKGKSTILLGVIFARAAATPWSRMPQTCSHILRRRSSGPRW